jgi:hypothetical protein
MWLLLHSSCLSDLYFPLLRQNLHTLHPVPVSDFLTGRAAGVWGQWLPVFLYMWLEVGLLHLQGAVANFVETEQLVTLRGPSGPVTSSFVQVRGSIPLLWSQIPNIKYKPTTHIAPPSSYEPVFDRHIKDLVEHYQVILLCLTLEDLVYDPMKNQDMSCLSSLPSFCPDTCLCPPLFCHVCGVLC